MGPLSSPQLRFLSDPRSLRHRSHRSYSSSAGAAQHHFWSPTSSKGGRASRAEQKVRDSCQQFLRFGERMVEEEGK